MSRNLHLNGVIFDGSNADFSAYTKLSVPVNTSADAPTRRDYVDAQVLEQKYRIDAILSGASVSLDNLKEISDYVISLDATQQTDILNKVATLNATITANKEASELRDSNLRSDLEAEAAARAAAVTTETNRATEAEQLVQSNLNNLSALEDKHYKQQTYLNEVEQQVRNVASVYADGSPALVPDAALLSEMGWYYKKSAAVGQKKHNWYVPVPEGLKVKMLKSISLFAKIQTTTPLQSVGDLPLFGVYTARLGDGNDRASWYRSRISWGADFLSGQYDGKKVFRVKLDATREHINNGDYSPVEYSLAANNLYSTGSSSLYDVGEESVSLLHISSNSTAAAYQEYFIHALKLQLEAHTHKFTLDGADVDLEKRVANVQTNLNTDKSALQAADATEAAARIAGDQTEATARVDAIQQEAAARQAAIEAEANARAIKDGEQDAALEAERIIRRDEVLAAQEYTGLEILRVQTETTASILSERDGRLEQANLQSQARIAADDAIIATAATNKAAADLAIERLAELYAYFNQTYASVYTHNHPILNAFIDNTYYIAPFNNINWESYTAANHLPDFTMAARPKATTDIIGIYGGHPVVIRKVQMTVHLPKGLSLDTPPRWFIRYHFEIKRAGSPSFVESNMIEGRDVGFENGEYTFVDTEVYAEVSENPQISVAILPGDKIRCRASYEYAFGGDFSLNKPNEIKYSQEFTYGL